MLRRIVAGRRRPGTEATTAPWPHWGWAVAVAVALAGVFATYELATRAPRTSGPSPTEEPAPRPPPADHGKPLS